MIPQLLVSEVHNVGLGNSVNDALNLAGAHATAGGDDLAADILGNSRGTVEREEDGSLELGLGTLDLSSGDVAGEARPLAKGEVNKVINAGQLVGNEVDTPETAK